jgi:hypothetical protein
LLVLDLRSFVDQASFEKGAHGVLDRFLGEPGHSQYRLLVGVGQVVALYVIEAQLTADGAVELV